MSVSKGKKNQNNNKKKNLDPRIRLRLIKINKWDPALAKSIKRNEAGAERTRKFQTAIKRLQQEYGRRDFLLSVPRHLKLALLQLLPGDIWGVET